ncbi:MAG: HAMP domain-containing histidine kinase, partial [Nitrosopumilus sp.]|nr:HAMP domain-containing histidine kinase [Nitrosopumilus sp.]
TTHQSILSSRDSIIFLYLITISSSFLVGFFIIRSILKPINHLGNIERKISNGDFNTKIEKISNDELGSLTESFDKMIQEIKKSRVNLEKTTALNSLEEISARLAHDMRDPLNIIKGVYQLLSLKLYEKLDEKEKINFQRMGKGIDRLEFQIDDVLNFARTKALRLETISVNKLIQESVYLSIIPKNIILNIEKSKLNLICDKEKMIAVIANLIKNAVESIGTDGKIEIKIEENKDHLIIKFIDSGKGIDEDKLDLIFAPLFTTKFSGTGLGLSTCKNILTQHNGSISVKNNPTTFTVTLPKNLKP